MGIAKDKRQVNAFQYVMAPDPIPALTSLAFRLPKFQLGVGFEPLLDSTGVASIKVQFGKYVQILTNYCFHVTN